MNQLQEKEAVLTPQNEVRASDKKFIVWPSEIKEGAPLGGKVKGLARLTANHFPVPPWVVVHPNAFLESLRSAESPVELHCGEKLKLDLMQSLEELCPGRDRVAVRSAGLQEDGVQHSFAGLLQTFLDVEHHDVSDNVVKVWRSAFDPRVLSYRQARGMASRAPAPAVIIQRMVRADKAGVAFSLDPMSGNSDYVVVTAVKGAASLLMDGHADGETWHVNRRGAVIKSPGKNTHLTSEEACLIAQWVRKIETSFGSPQDIEWALEGGRFYFLQARPITALGSSRGKEAPILWDNSNIADSFGGVTTPLTFSLARQIYAKAYRRFFRLMGAGSLSSSEEDLFHKLLGFIQGRIYCNLTHWYRALMLLPGFKWSRSLLEEMMGYDDPGLQNRRHFAVKEFFLMLMAGGRMLGTYFTLNHKAKLFHDRVDTLFIDKNRIGGLREEELARSYHDLEKEMITCWDLPFITDSLALIFHRALTRICGDPGLQNALLSEEGMKIAELPSRLKQMSLVAAESKELVRLLRFATEEEILENLPNHTHFKSLFDDYLESFGDRCADDLRLETATARENPLPVFRTIGSLAFQDPGKNESDPQSQRKKALQQVNTRLSSNPIYFRLFHWLLRNTRDLIRHRENFRFERTRLFGHIRRIFTELGLRYYRRGLLVSPHDIFFLTIEESLGFIDGTASTVNLRDLVTVRKKEYERFSKSVPPPNRFETRGIADLSFNIIPLDQKGVSASEELKGIACSGGKVCGKVQKITNPHESPIKPGRILVLEHTDPSSILLFTHAAGLLVERGSALSHAAVLAREMGLPTIVSLKGLTRRLKDGDHVELDGTSGIVKKLNGTPAPRYGFSKHSS